MSDIIERVLVDYENKIKNLEKEKEKLRELLKEHILLEEQRSMPIREYEKRSQVLFKKAKGVN